ncbi:hypothetical protein GGR57DRAFT_97374 [Xylariaceae sp. FL1272]|nr:hypothetical protein GGR57DRAFT_97374 [Xylariaceae sp. FL1272]
MHDALPLEAGCEKPRNKLKAFVFHLRTTERCQIETRVVFDRRFLLDDFLLVVVNLSMAQPLGTAQQCRRTAPVPVPPRPVGNGRGCGAWRAKISSLLSDRRITAIGLVLAVLSTVLTIVALLPGFRGQDLAQKSLDLAEWTALRIILRNVGGFW